MRTFGIRHQGACAGATFLVLSMTMLWPPSAIGRDMSLTCAYEIMTSAREAMVLCGDTLDPRSERTYRRFRATLQNFINENVKLDREKIGAGYDQVRSLRLREDIANGFCRQRDYRGGKVLLQELLRREATFRERIERSVNPTEGDCL